MYKYSKETLGYLPGGFQDFDPWQSLEIMEFAGYDIGC
jgi:hypothetical protein